MGQFDQTGRQMAKLDGAGTCRPSRMAERPDTSTVAPALIVLARSVPRAIR